MKMFNHSLGSYSLNPDRLVDKVIIYSSIPSLFLSRTGSVCRLGIVPDLTVKNSIHS